METPIIKVYELIETKYDLFMSGAKKFITGKKTGISEFKQLKELPQVEINDLQKEFLVSFKLKNKEEFEYLKRYYSYIVKSLMINFQIQVDELLRGKKSSLNEYCLIIKKDIETVRDFIYSELNVYESTLTYNPNLPAIFELVRDETEPMPEYEYQSSQQKIAWLYELGIIPLILERTKEGEFFNPSRTANVISSFCDVKSSTLRKGIDAIVKPNKDNKKNNPYTNEDNRLFISDMLSKFKINKKKKE